MFHRTLMSCRVKTRIIVIGLSVLVICSLLIYGALTFHIAKHHPAHSPMPGIKQALPQRLHSDADIPGLDVPLHAQMLQQQEFRKNLLYANSIPEESGTVRDRDLLSADSKEALTKFLGKLYPTNWATTPETDEVALDLKYLLLDYGFDSRMSCKQIDNMKLGGPVSHSAAKFVEYAFDDPGTSDHFGYNDNIDAYIVKSSSNDAETKFTCMQQIHEAALCATMGAYRLLREVLLLNALRHPNILMMKGYCLRGNRVATQLQEKGLIVVTEVGTPMSFTVLGSFSWSQRVSMALQIGQLILYLNSSPLGSLRFKKLNLRDFVLMHGTVIKLADLDDLEVGEKTCTEDSHCQVPDVHEGVQCKSGYCEGMNHIINYKMVVKEVLLSILQNAPGSDEEALVTRLKNLDVNMTQFLAQLQVFFNKSQEDVPLHHVPAESNVRGENKDSQEMSRGRQNNMGDNHVQAAVRGERVSLDEVLSKFKRYNGKNFAGIYDYLCSNSRVSWGCVHTVTSLSEAASLCLRDHRCLCFVTFSIQPESDNLMTVVFKNGTDSNPHDSSGTTLFIRHSPRDVNGRDRTGDKDSHVQEKRITVGKSSAEIQNCIDDKLQTQDMARFTREKRLMTHLGLKGIREQAWRRSALRQKMDNQSQLMRAEGGGGRFLANLTRRDADGQPDNNAMRVVFISEDGPFVYHMSYAVVYHLDRVLGLYHTSPCVGKQLSAEAVENYLRNSQWDEIFRPLIESDGTLSGLLVPPVPRIMKHIKLTLKPRKDITSKVVPFSRAEKLQLEYILLWWLARIDYKSSDHLGYKGHLIHFYADKAFGNMDLDMSGYLYHCQFPSTMYTSLTCFTCDSTQPEVCFLGEEVIKRVRAMFADDAEFFIHNMREGELIAAINVAATSIMHIIDVCIKTFDRESVLY